MPRTRVRAIFASTFDPPGLFHRAVVEALLESGFDDVTVYPTGRRPGETSEHAAAHHRAAMADLAFRGLPVEVDLHDLDEGTFTPHAALERRYSPTSEVWHVVGAELIAGGGHGSSIIHHCWEQGRELWNRSRFLVVHSPDSAPDHADLPPNCRLLSVGGHVPSADLRSWVYHGGSIAGYLAPAVADYIARHKLFLPFTADRATRFTLDSPRLLVVFDERNDRARAVAELYLPLSGNPPDLILAVGGDGTMLHAIRRHWRMRVPFLGVNAGHLGFLMNERLPADLSGLELVTRTQSMLRVDSTTPDGRVTHGLAYSDAWLERADGQAAWIRLDVDGQTRVPKVVGDGVLVATPSGSSAYARAMGASPVPLDTNVITLAGSNVFRPRFWKPMALSDDVVVELTSLDRSGKRPVRGFLDGSPLGVVQSMTLRRSNVAAVELAFTREFDPSDKLLRSLLPPVEEE